MDALEFLSKHVPLFSGIAEGDLSPLAEGSTLRKFASGQIIFYGGMSVEFLHVVATGQANIHAKVPGKGLMCVAELGPGDVFGEASILDGSLASATVKAGDPGAMLLLVPEDRFRTLYRTHEEFRVRLDELIAGRQAPPN